MGADTWKGLDAGKGSLFREHELERLSAEIGCHSITKRTCLTISINYVVMAGGINPKYLCLGMRGCGLVSLEKLRWRLCADMSNDFGGIDQLQFPEELNLERDILTRIISLPVPPDGGWGWVVVFASFIFNTIVDGILGSIGVVIPSIQRTFNVSLFMASLVASIIYSITYAFGPIVGYLFNRFGVRPICIASSILASGSFLCSYYATSFEVLLLTMGVLAGAALCTLSFSAQVMVGFYFDKRRPVALSLACLGSSFGASIFPVIMSTCLRQFGWHRTLIMISGFVALSIPLSLTMRPITPPKIVNQCEGGEDRLSTDGNAINFNVNRELCDHRIQIRHFSLGDIPSGYFQAQKSSKKATNDENLMDALITCKNNVVTPEVSEGNLSCFTTSTHTYLGSTCSNIMEIQRESRNVPDMVNRLIQLVEYKIGKKSQFRFSVSEGDIFRKKYESRKRSECVNAKAKRLIMKWINKIYTNPFNKLELLHTSSRHSLAEKGFICDENDLRSLVNIPTIEEVVHGGGMSKILFNKAIFKSTFIMIYYIASFMMFCAVLIPYLFMIQLTEDYCKHGDILISLLGVGGMISRFSSGFIIEKGGVDVFKYNDCGFYLMFICMLLMPILRTSLAGMAINSICYGLSYGNVFYTPPLIFCNTLGIQKLTSALSIHMLVKGIGFIVGIIGFGKSVSDESIGVVNTFYIASGIVFIAASMQTIRHIRPSTPKNKSELASFSQ